MPEFDQEQLRKWAVSGAEQRLLEIAAEAAAIYQAFPELRQRGGGRQAGDAGAGTATRAGRSNNMSAANRRAVSERMKKYWAARRGRSGRTAAGAAKSAPAGRNRLSPAARKRISDAQKKRWAAHRKGAGSASR